MTEWAPVVYGRTAASDTWWRAIPIGMDEGGWLGAVVHAAVCGGRELDRAPRFLLAQNSTHRIVGVACQAADLGVGMASDGHREFYCLVGWVGSRPSSWASSLAVQPEPTGPDLQELRRSYARWAGPVYERIVGPVWEASPTAFCPPESTSPEPALWPPAAGQELVPAGMAPEDGLWPEETWPALWVAAQAASTPLTCVVGWQHASSARAEGATHLGAADASERRLPAVSGWKPVAQAAEPDEPPLTSAKVPESGHGQVAGSEPAGRPGLVGSSALVTRSERPRRLLISAGFAAAALAGAAIGAVITALVSGGSPSPTAALPEPITIQVIVPASTEPGQDALLRYRDGALSAGDSTARLSVWTSGAAPTTATCASALSAAPSPVPVTARAGLMVCLELTGQQPRYGLIDVTKVQAASVTTVVTFWP
jgi:hypothetical protein